MTSDTNSSNIDERDKIESCKICRKQQTSPGPAMEQCSKCGAWFHMTCFMKKYGGASALPGAVFVCASCVMDNDNNLTSSALTESVIASNHETPVTTANTNRPKTKRSRGNSVEQEDDNIRKRRDDGINKTEKPVRNITSSIVCRKCNEETPESDIFECYGCTRVLHVTCDKLLKRDYDAWKRSSRLKLFCMECCEKTDSIVADNIKLILKYVEKIDLHTQLNQVAQKDTDLQLNKVVSTNEKIETSVIEIKNSIGGGTDQRNTSYSVSAESSESNNANNNNRIKTFARVVRESMKPSIVVKPKKAGRNSKETFDEIKSKVSYRDIEACGVRNVHGGGLLINCESNSATIKLKQMVEKELGDKYEVKLPSIAKPRLKIVNATNDLSESEIPNEIRAQNNWIDETAEIGVKAILKKKKSVYGEVDIIIEIDNKTYDKMMTTRRLNLGWKRCNVVEHIHVTRCFKCSGFNHVSKHCKNDTACGKCSAAHKTSECKANIEKCANCSRANDKYKLKIDCQHNSWSKICPSLKRKTSEFVRNLQYSEK